MKRPLQFIAVCLVSFAAVAAVSADPVLLTSGAGRVADGRYLYFSASQPFLSQAFYPGNPESLVTTQGYRDGTLAPATIATGDVDSSWISFASGDLTNGLTTTAGSVSGWMGQVSGSGSTRPGPYVLVDLGALYSLSSINIRLYSATGYRWIGTENAQEVWFASSLSAAPGTGVTLDSSTNYWTQGVVFTAVSNGETNVTLTLNQDARYVLLRLTAGTVDSSNAGGVLREVNIYGELAAIPEPAASAALAGCCVCGVLAYARFRKSR